MEEHGAKVGDIVKRISGCWNDMEIGDTDVVVGVEVDGTLILGKYGYGHSRHASTFEIINKKHHVHHDLIIAWAKGAEIEHFSDGEWHHVSFPNWLPLKKYRIKPNNETLDKIAEVEKKMKELSEELDKLKKEL